MRFPGNCLLVALLFGVARGGRLCSMRNRKGRVHFYWEDAAGQRWEFYTKGASQRSYLRNALTLGSVRKITAPSAA